MSPAVTVIRLVTGCVTCCDSNICIAPTKGISVVHSGRTAIISLNKTNRLFFVIMVLCVYCEVGTELLLVMLINFKFQRIS